MPPPLPSDDLFAGCESLSELFVAVHHLIGMPCVETFLEKLAPDCSRQAMRNAAGELKRVGLVDLAATVRKHARRAPLAPPTLADKFTARKQRD